MTSNKKIIGIGNAIMDSLCNVDEAFLAKNSLVKGSMSLIAKSTLANFGNLALEKSVSGGSVANTINALGQLGNEVCFLGSVGNDSSGQDYINDLSKNNVKFIGQFLQNKDTASSFIFITPDAQRTMCTYLGCAPIILDENIHQDFFATAKILYIEGYLWDSPSTISSIKKAIELAKIYDCKIAFSLSDTFCVQRHRADFIDLIKNHIDILFANESEIIELASLEKYDSSAINNFLNNANSEIIVAVTKSEKGCDIFAENSIINVPTESIKPLDTTGAGDGFACGFLHGYVREFELQKCAEIGNLMASAIIQKIGARFENSEIINLKKYI